MGDYPLTIDELRESHLVNGSTNPWDSAWRCTLVNNLHICARVLWKAGIDDIFIDGSFVEEKAHPADIDGYFLCGLRDFASGNLERRLNLSDPNTFWTWNSSHRTPDGSSTKAQLPMWHTYRVELYPHFNDVPQPSGICDAQGNQLPFPAAFRQQRGTYAPKGIIQLKRGSHD